MAEEEVVVTLELEELEVILAEEDVVLETELLEVLEVAHSDQVGS